MFAMKTGLVLRRRWARSIKAIALAAFFVGLSGLCFKAEGQRPTTFMDQCRQRDQLSAPARQTIDVLLTIVGSTDCQTATAHLLELTELDLSDRQISDLMPLSSLTHLQRLYLNHNHITDLSPLTGLIHLTDLYLLNNQITDVKAIASLANLRTLYLDNNLIQDPSPLSHLRSLTILYANHNQIETLDFATQLPNLAELYLNQNYITNIRPLRSLSQLTHLNLGNNRIVNIEPLATLNRLVQLDLNDNQISQLDSLLPLQRLTALDLRNNPVIRKTCPVAPATVCLFTDDAAELYQQGQQQLDTGDWRAALNTFQAALEVYQTVGDRLRQSDALDRIGNVYDQLGQYANSLNYYQQGAAIRTEIGDRQGEGETLTYLGITYIRVGQTENAIDSLQQSWDIYQTLAIGERSWLRPEPREGIILSNLALAYSQAGELSESLRFAKLSLASYRRGNDRPGEAIALNRVGSAYLSIGDVEKARLYLEKALRLTQEQDDRAGMADSLQALGNLSVRVGEPTVALDHYQHALDLRQSLGDVAGEGETLNAMGEQWLQLGKPAEAVEALQAAVAMWEALRPGLTDENKISIAETQAHTYQLLQQALIELGDVETALVVSERGRARAFAELLAHRLSLRGQTAPPDQVQPPAIAQIRQIAHDQNATVVEYSVVGEEIYSWVVEPTGVLHFRQQSLNGRSLADRMQDNRLALGLGGRGLAIALLPGSSSSPTSDTTSLQQLYQLLIQPIADVLPADTNAPVIIIPQGELFLVPFAALLDETGIAFIEKHPLLSAAAISLLAISHAPGDSLDVGREPALVVGNPVMPDDPDTGVSLPSLRGAEQEALTIASLLNTQALIGAAATKAAVLSQLDDVAIAHFATHGLLDDFGTDIPGALALSPTATDSGFLTAAEIFTVPMKAKLVVLSACDTGRGTITGDGVVGLSRSFLTAGVESVIVSLWSVPDEPTALLMTEFYRQLQHQPNRAIALRQAMLATRQRYPDPSNWAAFTLFGEMGESVP